MNRTITTAAELDALPVGSVVRGAAFEYGPALVEEVKRLRAALAVVRDHPPVKPDRETVCDEIAGHPIGSGYYATAVGVDEAAEIADAVLDLLPGRSEAEVKAEAWDEGAKAAWEASAERWNGEYPLGAKHDAYNPYRLAAEGAYRVDTPSNHGV